MRLESPDTRAEMQSFPCSPQWCSLLFTKRVSRLIKRFRAFTASRVFCSCWGEKGKLYRSVSSERWFHALPSTPQVHRHFRYETARVLWSPFMNRKDKNSRWNSKPARAAFWEKKAIIWIKRARLEGDAIPSHSPHIPNSIITPEKVDYSAVTVLCKKKMCGGNLRFQTRISNGIRRAGFFKTNESFLKVNLLFSSVFWNVP